MKEFFVRRIVFILLALSFVSPSLVSAQTSCGDIIDRAGGEEYIVPIEDCTNPFGVIVENQDIRVSFLGTQINAGASYGFLNATDTFTVTGTHPDAFFVHFGLYQHIPEGYLRINQNDQDQFTFTEAGTYTVVVYEEGEIILSHNWLQRVIHAIVPTAYAFPGPARAITFTVTEPETEKQVSNILFIPGIQASRLYKDGVLGTEDQIWPPSANFGGDMEDLAMTSEGLSENVIYTRDVIDSTVGVGSIYGDFLDYLEDLKTASNPIKEFSSYAYDWRYDVFDIVDAGAPYENELKSLIDEVTRLSQSSYTNKVTIIAHSNGGLLAKALMIALKNRGDENLVDRVILIGTPQLGTPKAIATILHGYDQSDGFGGVFLDSEGARTVMNNMPGVYSLLPSQKFISGTTEPIVTFDKLPAENSYRKTYGDTINSFEKYSQFLKGINDPSARTLDGLISIPAKANDLLLQQAFDNHENKLDNWIAPTGVEVIEIVGTGLPTMKSLEYRSITEDNCIGVIGNPAICSQKILLKPYAQFTKYGDETVVQTSANAYFGMKDTFYFNLNQFKKDFPDSKYRHVNLTEVSQIQDLITNIVLATSTDTIKYVSTSATTFLDEYTVEIIDSPVRLIAEDSEGNQTGIAIVDGKQRLLLDIPGSQYFELGDTKYLVMPKSTQHTTTLTGEAYGGYGLTIATLNKANSQSIVHQFQNASVTPSMIASYSSDGSTYSPILTDLDGDGDIDSRMTVDGVPVAEKATYDTLIEAIRNLHLSKVHESTLIALVKHAERVSKQHLGRRWKRHVEISLLSVVEHQIEKYMKRKLVTKDEYRKIERIIQPLKNNNKD